jgi:hypothetical protein
MCCPLLKADAANRLLLYRREGKFRSEKINEDLSRRLRSNGNTAQKNRRLKAADFIRA